MQHIRILDKVTSFFTMQFIEHRHCYPGRLYHAPRLGNALGSVMLISISTGFPRPDRVPLPRRPPPPPPVRC